VTDAALRLDAYLEELLADREARRPRPAAPATPAVDPREAVAADLLARGLVRFHPSFRFEEALAARLRATADSMRLAAAAGGSPAEGTLLSFPGLSAASPMLSRERVPARGLLVGGAIASGVSLAGAAILAWRRGHRLASEGD